MGTELGNKEKSSVVRVVGANKTTTGETVMQDVSANQEGKVVDTIDNGAIDTMIPVTTSPVEGKVGGSRLTDRKYIWMQGIAVPNSPNAYILWGFTNSTQSFKLFKDQLLTFPIGDGTQVWFKTPAGTGSVAFGEGA
jgi:hypothetical protein